MPHLCRCLCLGGSLFLTCVFASAAPRLSIRWLVQLQVFAPGRFSFTRWCRFLSLEGFLFLTGAEFCAWKVLCAPLMQVLCLGGYICPTCAVVCAWEVMCALLVQVSVLVRFSVPHWCRFLSCIQQPHSPTYDDIVTHITHHAYRIGICC